MADLLLNFKLVADGSGFAGQVRVAAAEIRRIGGAAQDATRQGQAGFGGLIGTVNALGTVVRTIVGGIIVSQFIGMGKSILDAGMQLQKVQLTLEAVTGSAGAAARELEFVREVSARLGIEVTSAAAAYAKLAASAQGTALAGRPTREIFEAVANAAGRLGLTAAETDGALLAISQMMSKGTVAAEELRGQLGERLPGAFGAAARAMGVSTQELGKMLEQGALITDEFLPKFAAELNKTYGAGGPITTAQSEVARLGNEWEKLKQTIAGAGVQEASNFVVKEVRTHIEAFNELMKVKSVGFTEAVYAAFMASIPPQALVDRAKEMVAEEERDLPNQIQRVRDYITRLQKAGTVFDLQEAERQKKILMELRDRYVALDDSSYDRKELNRAGFDPGPPKAYLDALKDLSGVSAEYNKKLAAFSYEYRRGGISVEQYRSLVERLIITETDAGKAAAEAMKDRIKGYESLRDAIRGALSESTKEAEAARERATAARDAAADIRASTADKVAQLRQKGMTPEEVQADQLRRSEERASAADFALAHASLARMEGRVKDFERYAEQASKLAQQAQDLGVQGESERAVEAAGRVLESVQTERAKFEEGQAAEFEARAKAQADTLRETERTIAQMMVDAASIGIEVKGADEALAAVQAIKAAVDAIPPKKVIEISWSTGAAAETKAGNPGQGMAGLGVPGFAAGGPIRGPGGPTADRVLMLGSAGEWVIRAAAVQHYGADLFSALNRLAIPRFAGGGQVARQPIYLSYPGAGPFIVEAQPQVASQMVAAFRREVSRRGRRL